MAEPVYGAFGDILNLDDEGVDPIVYNVYQQQQQDTLNHLCYNTLMVQE